VDGARLNAAHGDGDGEDDRKERFHSTIIFVAARSDALIPNRRSPRRSRSGWESYSAVLEGLSFCATRIWKPVGLCVVGSTGWSVKIMVVPGVMTSFALARNAAGS
jgi:hypothetical protein